MKVSSVSANRAGPRRTKSAASLSARHAVACRRRLRDARTRVARPNPAVYRARVARVAPSPTSAATTPLDAAARAGRLGRADEVTCRQRRRLRARDAVARERAAALPASRGAGTAGARWVGLGDPPRPRHRAPSPGQTSPRTSRPVGGRSAARARRPAGTRSERNRRAVVSPRRGIRGQVLTQERDVSDDAALRPTPFDWRFVSRCVR